ncbi:Crp/Fnr family transcriptional regulator [Streptomyces sp. NPDC002545]
MELLKTPRQHEASVVGEHLSQLDLPAETVNSLATIGRLRHRDRGDFIRFPLSRSSFLLVKGCISEIGQHGKARLWRDTMIFENMSSRSLFGAYNDERTSPDGEHGNSFTSICLSPCTIIELPNSKLSSMAMAYPAIGLVLAGMATKRHTVLERLYTATRATPVARVAAVLDYLTETTRKSVLKTREDGAVVVTLAEELVASGPSQADIADALCLGRATVEKAVSQLRQTGALKAFSPGERTNRCYPVKDRDLLRQIALGG